jgi:hypothetical protein
MSESIETCVLIVVFPVASKLTIKGLWNEYCQQQGSSQVAVNVFFGFTKYRECSITGKNSE